MKKFIMFMLLLWGLYYYSNIDYNYNEKPNIEEIIKEWKQTYMTSFESIDDFKWFYITPEIHKWTTFQSLSEEVVRSWKYSHKVTINWTNKPSTTFVNNNHRWYPTIQLHKSKLGSFQTPIYTTFWVWVDMDLEKNNGKWDDDWLSLATFSDDTSDNWKRTVLVNLNADWYIHLMHTTAQWKKDYIFQTSNIKFPQKQWVEIKVYLDFRENAYAKVWQNGKLVSHAKIWNIKNKLAQAHFWMYAPPYVNSGLIYNDDLKIEMVNWE